MHGGTVEVGPFIVSAKGVEKDAELVPWPAVREVGMSNGVVYVRRVDQVITIAATAARMPNAAAFIALCRHLAARRGDLTHADLGDAAPP